MHLFGDVEVKFNAICDALKQTMVHQDIVFQNQVMELHRLYSVQKSLMDDPNWTQPDSNKRSYCDIPLAGSSQFNCRGKARKYWDNISNVKLPTPNLRQKTPVPQVVKSHHASNVIFIDLEEDEVTTNGKAELSTQGKAELPVSMNKKHNSFVEIIDLDGDEDCTSSVLCEKAKDSVLGVPPIIDRVSSPAIDINKVQNDGIPASWNSDANPSVIDSAYTTRRPTSGYHNDFPPSIISSNTYCRQSKDSSSNTYEQVIDSRIHLSDSERLEVHMKPSGSKCEVDTENKLGLIDLNSAPSSFLDPLEDVGNYSANSGIENDCLQPPHFIIGLDSERHRDFSKKHCDQIHAASPQANSKGSEDQAFVSSCSYETPNNRDVACWRLNSFNNNSSSSQKTPQSKVEMGGANMCSPTEFADAHSGADVAGSISSDINSRPNASRRLCYSMTDEESTPDPIIEDAADVLIHLSVIASSVECKNITVSQEKEKNHMLATSVECTNRTGSQEKNHMLDYSSDSFEANTLKIVESSADDYFRITNAYQVSDMEKKDSGLKLMRGRRMKDFQKDILPGLSSLSWQEILEDISIFVGVMRSREYRKTRAKMGEDNSWCLPRRCKRSRR